MRSTPRENPITVSGVTGTNQPYGQHDPYSPAQPHDPSGGWQQPPAYYTQPIQAPPPRRGMSTGAIIGIVVAIVAVLCVGAAVAFTLVPPPKEKPLAADGNAGTPAPYDTSQPDAGTPTSTPASAAPAAGPMTTFGDGTHEVGTGPGQIPPGTYTAVVPDQAFDLCLWSRLRGFSGEGKDVIAFGTGNKGDKQRVNIAATDKGFDSNGCGTWGKA